MSQLSFNLLVGVIFCLLSAVTRAEVSCDCEKLKCSPCEENKGVQFYTQKCDGERKIKSCSRPTCEPLTPPTPECVAYLNKKRQPASVAAEQVEKAVENKPVTSLKTIGVVVFANGDVAIYRNGKSEKAKAGKTINEADILETGEDGQLKITFTDNNQLMLTPKSKVDLREYKLEHGKEKSRVLLDFIYGKIRNTVKPKYDDTTENFYRIKTPTAVAGVRGTDFVASFDDAKVTNIATLNGKVVLAAVDDLSSVEIPAGQETSYVPATDKKKGYFSEAHVLNNEAIAKLEESFDFKRPEPKEICHAPKGLFNDCSWTCENNPKNAKICRTDLPQVKCIRRRCNANGAWAEELRLPSSRSYQCDVKVKVQGCDY